MRKIVVAITGASGSIYASLLIEKLLAIRSQWETVSIVMTKNARTVWETELENQAYKDLPLEVFETDDFMAPFASGSARYDTMIIIPCSMGTSGPNCNRNQYRPDYKGSRCDPERKKEINLRDPGYAI